MMSDPEYKRALNESYNGYPIEQGAWIRRPPFHQIGYTRLGAPAKLLPLSGRTKGFYNMELTAGHMRFVQGAQFVTDATRAVVTNLTTANPTVMTIDSDKGWQTGDQLIFQMQGNAIQTLALLTHRVLLAERLTGTTYALHDLLTGRGVNGVLMTWDASYNAFVGRVTDLVTPYSGTMWKSVKIVQTDKSALLLHAAVWPQLLTYTVASDATWASVGFSKAIFQDGPYLDAVPGSIATPDGTTGIINLTFGFTAYDSTVAYNTGAYVTSSSKHWKSLKDQNINNAPADASAFWQRVGATDFLPAKAFAATDVGRHIRLLSEPPAWAVGTTYADGNIVSLATSAGGNAYWMCIAAGTVGAGSNQPGSDPSKWVPYASGALWTWGLITGSASGTPIAGTASVGNLTTGPGLTALFDGVNGTQDSLCPRHQGTTGYGGLHVGSPTAVTGASVWPGRNAAVAGGSGGAGVSGGTSLLPGVNLFGFTGTVVNPPNPVNSNGGAVGGYTFAVGEQAAVTINLRAKATAPSSSSDGTLLGSTGVLPASRVTAAPIRIASNDGTTTFSYVWLEIIINPTKATSQHFVCAAEMEFYSAGTGGSGLSVQIMGKPLLYTAPINTWLLGLFNDTDPLYPTAGCYAEGRVWLGVGNNHFVASQPVGLSQVISFSPTEEDGTVTDASAINYTFNSEINAPIFWMLPTDGGIVLGHSGGERLLFSTTADQSITPTNINVELKTFYTSADVEPVQTPLTAIFVHSNGRDVHEYMRDAYSGRFVIPPLTEYAKSLTETGVVQLAYQRATTPIIWACTQDGRLVGDSYERLYLPFRSESPPKYNGWHRHEHGADRDFLSVSVGPSVDGTPIEALAVITQDRETGRCRIEVSGSLMPENNDIYDCNFLDGMFVPQNLGTYVERPPNPDIIPPPPPTPGVYRWVMPGYTLFRQCPPQVAPLPNPTGTVLSGDPSEASLPVYLTPPTSLGAGGPCDLAIDFYTVPQVPGYNTGFPVVGQQVSILQYMATVFGANKFASYQIWLPNSPSSVASQPTWTNT